MIGKIADFVKNGGTFYATYMLGMVNETDLCYLGGFPAKELKEVFGIWNEEIDTFYPDERGAVLLEETAYSTKDYAEIIHVKTASVLARYEKDFYKGFPAYTLNEYGKGKAYYQAFRDTGEFKDKAIENILKVLGIKGCIEGELPDGVSAHARTDGETTYFFVENYTQDEIDNIPLDDTYENMLTGEKTCFVHLKAYDICVLKK